MTKTKKRIAVLDCFRGIASFAVVLHHFILWPYGLFGVHFFFIISGFVIFYSIEKVKSGAEFAIKRFFRLYPTYWICLLLSTIFINFLPTYSSDFIDIKQFLVNLTMVQTLLGVDSVDHSYWSLVPELFFYGFIFIIYKLKQLENIQLIGFFWLIIIFLNTYFNLEAYIPYIRLLNIRHGQLFFAGILFYKWYQNQHNNWTIFGVFCCYFLSVYIYTTTYPVQYPFLSTTIILVIIFSSFVLFIKNKLGFLDIRILRFFGLISYPLYLLHQEIGGALFKFLNEKQFFSVYLDFILITAFIIALSYAVTKAIEQPIRTYSRELINKFNYT